MNKPTNQTGSSNTNQQARPDSRPFSQRSEQAEGATNTPAAKSLKRTGTQSGSKNS